MHSKRYCLDCIVRFSQLGPLFDVSDTLHVGFWFLNGPEANAFARSAFDPKRT
jgi:hypothetical protein